MRSSSFAACSALLAATFLPAQAPQAIEFRTADGSRFVLLPQPGAELVEWAIASPADVALDLPGLEGLSKAVVDSSLFGTWQIGSRDAVREKLAHERFEAAWREAMAAGGGNAAVSEYAAAQTELANLVERAAFRRALAAAPTHNPEVRPFGPVVVLALTTVAEALPRLSELLLQRREEQALRELPKCWTEELVLRNRVLQADPRTALYAEMASLVLGGDLAARNYEPPGLAPLQRRLAQQVWQRSQHPSQVVHVLSGGFDAPTLRKLLEQRFAATSLPAPAADQRAASRSLSSARFAALHAKEAATLFGYQLPANCDAVTASVLARLLDGATGLLADELQKRGQGVRLVRVQAPWPGSLGRSGALLIEVNGSGEALRQTVTHILAALVKSGPPNAQFLRAKAAEADVRAAIAADARWQAGDIAAFALRWPGQLQARIAPLRVDYAMVKNLAVTTFSGNAAIVEGKP